mgnify:CR=1 FL=1
MPSAFQIWLCVLSLKWIDSVNYHLKPAGKVCAATEREFVPGEICHSVLIERDGEITRLDFSDDGWTGPPDGAIGEWQTVVPDLSAKPRTVDTESLMRYFEQLCEDANPVHEQLRYVLALLLLQKRRLRLEGSRTDEDGNTFLEFIGRKSEGPFEVQDSDLTEEEISALQATLNTRLQEEIDQAA